MPRKWYVGGAVNHVGGGVYCLGPASVDGHGSVPPAATRQCSRNKWWDERKTTTVRAILVATLTFHASSSFPTDFLQAISEELEATGTEL